MTEQERDEIRLPLDDFVRGVAREAARTVIEDHAKACVVWEVQRKVDAVQLRVATLIGAIAGSGVLGGGVGALLSKLIG